VILSTLVLQGLTLPLLIRWLKIDVTDNEEEERLTIRLRLANLIVDHITVHYAEESQTIEPFSRLKSRYQRMAEITDKQLKKEEGEGLRPNFLPRYRSLLLELVSLQRQELSRMRHESLFSDETLRKKENELDLEEARFRRLG